MPKNKINQKENRIIFYLNTKIYTLEAIYSAAYIFIDKAYIYLDGDPKKEIIVSLKGKNKLNGEQLQSLAGEFYNELLNYLLRIEIARRTKKIRNFIVGTALVSALSDNFLIESSSIEDNGDNKNKEVFDDWQEDPMGIAIPWEEKYGDKKEKKKK